MLWEWNDKLNLTRHTDYEKFVARDLVDSLAFSRFLEKGEKVMDVGSGGGVPGVVLAILRDDLEVTLSESVGKKARALADIVARLGLTAPVHHGRAEELLARRHYTDAGHSRRRAIEKALGVVPSALGRRSIGCWF